MTNDLQPFTASVPAPVTAEAVAGFMRDCGLELKPVYAIRYDPFERVFSGFEIVSGDPAAGLAALEKQFERPSRKQATNLSLFLMANTRPAKDGDIAEALRLEGFIDVLQKFPAHIGERVIRNWHTREHAYARPAQGDLYKALAEEAKPYQSAVAALKWSAT